VVRRLILDSLRYWTEVMHVDGFRFDLAAILSRDAEGRPLRDPPLIWEIESDPVLSRTKLIAEAWDAAGLYQVGTFPGERWAEWNGHFRDDLRRFLRGDHGLAGAMASRMLGSPDLYERHRRDPAQSINYVTCHDGFTLNDLVSWAGKHNLANGEEGRDGAPDEHSANYGQEGPSDDPALEALRTRQVKNALALLLLAQGTPMLSMGDEVRRSQGGNNNAWCQDNPTSWLDWGLLARHAEVHRFTRLMIRFRRAHPSLARRHYLHGVDTPPGTDPPGTTQVRWHGVRCDQPDWSWSSRVLSFTLTASSDDVALHVIASMHSGPLDFELPLPATGRRWWRAIDTGRPSPEDVAEPGREVALAAREYRVEARSVVVLLER
jgi:glycogen operon protein